MAREELRYYIDRPRRLLRRLHDSSQFDEDDFAVVSLEVRTLVSEEGAIGILSWIPPDVVNHNLPLERIRWVVFAVVHRQHLGPAGISVVDQLEAIEEDRETAI